MKVGQSDNKLSTTVVNLDDGFRLHEEMISSRSLHTVAHRS